jgi:hypothetical protein
MVWLGNSVIQTWTGRCRHIGRDCSMSRNLWSVANARGSSSVSSSTVVKEMRDMQAFMRVFKQATLSVSSHPRLRCSLRRYDRLHSVANMAIVCSGLGVVRACSAMSISCHSPACDMLLGPLSEAPRLPTSPLRRRSAFGLHSGLPLASRLSDTHPGRSYVHPEPPHVPSHPSRPAGTVSCPQRHPSL